MHIPSLDPESQRQNIKADDVLRERIEAGFFLQHQDPGAFNMFDEQWDVLFLIDACRYDLFRERNTLPGRLERKISLASCTPEWAKKSFPEHDLSQIMYVSANPFISEVYLSRQHIPHGFRVLEELWETAWDDALKTVRPEPVTEAALRLHHAHPKQRLLVHYIQPHHPFIGAHAIAESGWEASRDRLRGTEQAQPQHTIYEKLQQGTVKREDVWSAYTGNFELVLREIRNHLSSFRGKKIITSDHGDCFGEYGVYAHPESISIPELVEVPWLEIAG